LRLANDGRIRGGTCDEAQEPGMVKRRAVIHAKDGHVR
jgi:hypothetical protein